MNFPAKVTQKEPEGNILLESYYYCKQELYFSSD